MLLFTEASSAVVMLRLIEKAQLSALLHLYVHSSSLSLIRSNFGFWFRLGQTLPQSFTNWSRAMGY